MALSRSYRWVLVCNLLVRKDKRVPSHLSTFDITDFLSMLKDRHRSKTTGYIYHNGVKQIAIRDINEDQNFFYILLSYGDKDASDAAYLNFTTHDTKRFPKGNDEDVSVTAHISI